MKKLKFPQLGVVLRPDDFLLAPSGAVEQTRTKRHHKNRKTIFLRSD